MYTKTYGIAPSNTTLTVRYLTGGGVASNVDSNNLTILNTTNITFNTPNLTQATANNIFASLACNNPKAADGGGDGDSIEELRQNALGNFQTQLRGVTKEDYLIRTLSMPSNLGKIAKAHAIPSRVGDYKLGELPTILDLYVLTYDSNKRLKLASPLIKNNLKTYLSEYRMINDAINIKDAFIVNIKLDFDITVRPSYSNSEVLTKCIDVIQTYFNIDKWQINEPILLRDIYVLLDKVDGVQTVKNIVVDNLSGEDSGYSKYSYDIKGATIENVIYPSIDPMIFEIKYKNQDIKGRVSNF